MEIKDQNSLHKVVAHIKTKNHLAKLNLESSNPLVEYACTPKVMFGQTNYLDYSRSLHYEDPKVKIQFSIAKGGCTSN